MWTGKYTSTICYIFTINYILGVGCLGIPYAFLKSGVVLGSLLIILLSTVAYITVMWVAESGHRDLEIRQLEDGMTPTARSMGGRRISRRSRGRTWSSTNPPETRPFRQMESCDYDPSPVGAGPHKTYGALLPTTVTPSPVTPMKDEKVEFASLSNLIEQETKRLNTPSPSSCVSPHSLSHSHNRESFLPRAGRNHSVYRTGAWVGGFVS